MAGADWGLDKGWLHKIPREDCYSLGRMGRSYREGIRCAISRRRLSITKPATDFFHDYQTTILVIFSRKQIRPRPMPGKSSGRSEALVRLARTHFLTLLKAFGHLWHRLKEHGDRQAPGLGSDVDTIWDAVRKDAVEMCKLSSALTLVRLENQEKKFQ